MMTKHQQAHPGQKSVSNERHSLGRPQLFVQLTFGVSWSERYIPQTHTLTYTSKNLKNARNSGHFPRQQETYPQHRRQDPAQRQHRGESRGERQQQQQQQQQQHCRDYERPRGRIGPQPRPDSRRAHIDRGSSAPPPVAHDSTWDEDDQGGPSATLFPRPARMTRNATDIWSDVPTNPAHFRLGEDGLPWSVAAWPFDALDGDDNDDDDDDDDGHEDREGNKEEPPFANLPTTLPLSPPRRFCSEVVSEDPQRVRELASLSTAMVTVDNGFENQWWNQGTRVSTPWFAPDSPEEEEKPEEEEEEEEEVRPLSTTDAMLLSAAEPPSAMETYSPASASFHDLISPLSDFGPSFNISSPLQRSPSTRSDELWMDR